VAKILISLSFTLFFAQAIGVWSFVAERLCHEECPSERGACAPACPDCPCCAARVAVQRPVLVSSNDTPRPFLFPYSEAAPASPDPDEIIHIPKRPLV